MKTNGGSFESQLVLIMVFGPAVEKAKLKINLVVGFIVLIRFICFVTCFQIFQTFPIQLWVFIQSSSFSAFFILL